MSLTISLIPNTDNIPPFSIVLWSQRWITKPGLTEQATDCQQWLNENFPGTKSTLGEGREWRLIFPTVEEKTRFIMTWL